MKKFHFRFFSFGKEQKDVFEKDLQTKKEPLVFGKSIDPSENFVIPEFLQQCVDYIMKNGLQFFSLLIIL